LLKQSKVAVIRGKHGHEPGFDASNLIDYDFALSGFSKVLITVDFITTITGIIVRQPIQ